MNCKLTTNREQTFITNNIKKYKKMNTTKLYQTTSTTSFNIWERLELFLLSASWQLDITKGNSIYNMNRTWGWFTHT